MLAHPTHYSAPWASIRRFYSPRRMGINISLSEMRDIPGRFLYNFLEFEEQEPVG